jgi:1-acyl-sn-glycerol-3-phosphate acyltransferase
MKAFWNMRIEGMEEASLKEGSIVCANHQTFFDPPFLGAILPMEAYYLAKAELFRNKLFGALISFYNAIPIDRRGYTKSTLKFCEQLLRQGKTLLIFPEGSRKSFTAKPGIARIAWDTEVPIYPVKIENIDKFKECFFRGKHLRFIFRKPIYPEEYKKVANSKPDYKKMAQNILDIITGVESDEN